MKTNIIGVDVGGTKCAVTYGQKGRFRAAYPGEDPVCDDQCRRDDRQHRPRSGRCDAKKRTD